MDFIPMLFALGIDYSGFVNAFSQEGPPLLLRERNMLDEMIELIVVAFSNMPGGPDCYEAAAHLVIQTGLGVYTDKRRRQEWVRQLYEAAKARCSCLELEGISKGVRLDIDMESLERLSRCLAVMARRKAELAEAFRE